MAMPLSYLQLPAYMSGDWWYNMQPVHVIQAFKAYGIYPDSIAPPQSGYRNKVYRAQQGNQQYNLIIFKNEPEILIKVKQADRFSNYLAKQGLPVRTTLDQRILCLNPPNNKP